ncbi:MAG: 5-(carboxyamino)imidazole ribonucleotide synthase [Firmicutes bacterium]|nr:5-(carboxyamino)imidazole ribonucleotide synthase [Bacillota bacterium]MDD4694647.1 5-(carboxyamino)imidazole ribonucleotide synthase [Bacillota bacterium]
MLSSKWVGIIGGGQLGMMLTEEIHNFGSKTVVLDPDNTCPCTHVADEFICASFDDYAALKELCQKSDVVTYEFENVKSHFLIDLEAKYNIKQGIRPLFDSQDRLREKENAKKHGLKTARFFSCQSRADLDQAVKELGYPCIYKTRTLGYDGHGQVILYSDKDKDTVEPYLNVEGIVEEFIDFDLEVSVIMVRDGDKTIVFPIGKNIHKNGILDLSIVPTKLSRDLENRLKEASVRFMESADYRGILCIEYFVKNSDFYFNEMAPRPHNSGHYTIEGCTTNQYRELVKFLLGVSLEEPKLKSPTVMKNILGQDLWMVPKFEKPNALKTDQDLYVHMYSKKETRPLRKMGHVTMTNMTEEEYKEFYERKICVADK